MSRQPRRTVSLKDLIGKWAARFLEERPDLPSHILARAIGRKKVRLDRIIDKATIRTYCQEAISKHRK